MKKSIAVLIIIPLIIGISSYAQNNLISCLCSKAYADLTDISGYVETSEFKGALSAYNDYSEKWEGKCKILSYLISHDELDDIMIHNVRLSAYLETGNRTESMVTIGELKEIYRELQDIFKVNFKNIL